VPANDFPCTALLNAHLPRFPPALIPLAPTLNPDEYERRNSKEINDPLTSRVLGANLTGNADLEDFHYVECWKSWWFFRTLFQSFGENSTTVGATTDVLIVREM
jgi:hypothetical protein